MERVTEMIAFSNIYKKYKYNKYTDKYVPKYENLTKRQQEIYDYDYYLASLGYDYEVIEKMIAAKFDLQPYHVKRILSFVSKYLLSKD